MEALEGRIIHASAIVSSLKVTPLHARPICPVMFEAGPSLS